METSAKPRKILLVDDNPADLYIAREALKASGVGLELTALAGGQEALRVLREAAQKTPGEVAMLVLLDLNMPVMDGEATLREIRKDPAIWLTPVVMLTTSSANHDVARCYAAGANAYICKPLLFNGMTQLFTDLDRFWSSHVLLSKTPPNLLPRMG
ncbi:MAG: response regulator [Pseudomonadota bacterium]